MYELITIWVGTVEKRTISFLLIILCYNSAFVQLGFTMKLTHLSPVQYWFIHIKDKAYIPKKSA